MFKDKKRLREIGQNALIAALIVSAVLLARANGLFGKHAADSPQSSAPVAEGSITAAAVPFSMAVIPDAPGARCGITHGEAALEEMFGRFSATLGEALGSAGAPQNVSQAQWEKALTGTGVFFDYLYGQPLSVLSGWLGTETSESVGEHTARRLCLAAEEDGLALYFEETSLREYYRCTTALTASSILPRMQEYSPNGARFVWELTDDRTMDAYTLMEDGLIVLPKLSAANPLRDAESYGQISALMGLSGVARSYSEADGVVYVENDVTLRISGSGTVSYRGGENGLELGSARSLLSVVEAARALCQQGPGSSCGAARLSLSGLEYDRSSDTCHLRFDYSVEGIPLRLAEGSAAEITVTGGRLQEATLHFCSYTTREETVTPLPRMLALAAVRAVGGGEPLLAYTDNHKEIELQWLAA